MFFVLSNRTYRHLFLAQISSLIGTGLATVALGLLAYRMAGGNAGVVLGTALAIKMIAYVFVAPIASAFSEVLPRRRVLVTLDLIRAAMALSLPFVTEIWQIYVVIFLLQSASAGFTPVFQATIPDILTSEKDYTNALSLSRLAYDLESLTSPMLAGLLLLLVSHEWLFVGTSIGFVASAMLVVSVLIPIPALPVRRSIWDRTTRGLRIYLSTPRLRGLFAICIASAAAGSMVIVNTVLMVQQVFGLGERETAWAFAAFGGGSMLAAFLLPKALERTTDRTAVMAGVAIMIGGLVGVAVAPDYQVLLMIFAVLGFGYSASQTPSGRVLRRSSHSADRPSLFAAHFALSHFCWLFAYPLAGYAGAEFGMSATAIILTVLASAGLALAFLLWPRIDAVEVEHSHADLPAGHPHWDEGHDRAGAHHVHRLVIDDIHPVWPETNVR